MAASVRLQHKLAKRVADGLNVLLPRTGGASQREPWTAAHEDGSATVSVSKESAPDPALYTVDFGKIPPPCMEPVALAFVYWVLSGYDQDNVKAALEQFQAENEERFNDHDDDQIFMPYPTCEDDGARQRHGLPAWTPPTSRLQMNARQAAPPNPQKIAAEEENGMFKRLSNKFFPSKPATPQAQRVNNARTTARGNNAAQGAMIESVVRGNNIKNAQTARGITAQAPARKQEKRKGIFDTLTGLFNKKPPPPPPPPQTGGAGKKKKTPTPSRPRKTTRSKRS